MCKYHGHLGLTWKLFLWEFEVALVTAYSCSLHHMVKSIIGKWCHLQCSRDLPFRSVVCLVFGVRYEPFNLFFPFFMSNVMQGYYIGQKSHGVRNLPVCDNLPESFRCWRGYRLKSKRLQITSIAHINLIVRWEEVDGVTLKSVPKDLVPFIFHKYVKRRHSCIVRGDKATERMFHSR